MTSPPELKPASNASSPPAIATAGPSALRPSISIKPTPSLASPSPSTPCSVTSKEWVIPPRPKPGRKPATDTPPTKRKAQNRAAQRAFRERRAARVGELEEHIKQIEDEDEREQTALREEISDLSTKLEEHTNEINSWIERYNELNKDLQAEKRARDTAVKELAAFKALQSTIGQSPKPQSQVDQAPQPVEVPIGCGGCSSTSRCECLEAALDVPGITGQDPDLTSKRPHSPQHQVSDKRIKAEPLEEAMEMDFTSTFSKPQRLSQQDSSRTEDAVSQSSVVADPCGFCQDGTHCICAEMAAADNQRAHERARIERTNTIPSTNRLSQFTPPPSDGDVSLPLSNPVTTAASNSCINGAGTCAQCQADPNSTLFCKTLAASRAKSQSSEIPTSCCGGALNGQSCCQSRTLPPPTRRANSYQRNGQSPSSSVTLSCADAYTTLSRHPNYERAITSGDVGSWMPKLYASPSRHLHPPSKDHEKPAANDNVNTVGNGNLVPSAHESGRPAMEIEVANVMSVLREFDRRFGSNA